MLQVDGYKNVALVSLNIVPKGDRSFKFVEFIDLDSYKNSGQMMLVGKFTDQEVMDIAKLEKQPVNVQIEVSTYQGRASIACKGITPKNK